MKYSTKHIIGCEYALKTLRVFFWKKAIPVIIVQSGVYHSSIYYRGSRFSVKNEELSDIEDNLLCITFYKGKPVRVLGENKFKFLFELEGTNMQEARVKLDFIFCKINPRHVQKYLGLFGRCIIESVKK